MLWVMISASSRHTTQGYLWSSTEVGPDIHLKKTKTVQINSILHNKKKVWRNRDIPILLEEKTQSVSSQINLKIHCNHTQYPNKTFYRTWRDESKFHLKENAKEPEVFLKNAKHKNMI